MISSVASILDSRRDASAQDWPVTNNAKKSERRMGDGFGTLLGLEYYDLSTCGRPCKIMVEREWMDEDEIAGPVSLPAWLKDSKG